MKKVVSISLSPNLEKDDSIMALSVLFKPIKWFDFRDTEYFEKKFAEYFGQGYTSYALNSGRSALYIILKSIGIGNGDTICIQALTCSVVINAILALGAKPIYVDVDDNYNLDPIDLAKKIDASSKAVIVQHTFGIIADIETIKKIAHKNGLIIIEDCALSLGTEYKGKKAGTFGDVAFFSFGRDKVISSVFGGITLSNDLQINQRIKCEVEQLEYPSFAWLIQQLLHPIITPLIIYSYLIGKDKFTVGKILLFLLQKFGFLSKAIYKEEKMGLQSKYFPKKFPGGMAKLAINQFEKLERFNKNRIVNAKFYFKKLKNIKGIKLPKMIKYSIWHRFPILVHGKQQILRYFTTQGIVLGDWYKDVITPVDKPEDVLYAKGCCPKAEYFSTKLINLPTSINISVDIADLICCELIKWEKHTK